MQEKVRKDMTTREKCRKGRTNTGNTMENIRTMQEKARQMQKQKHEELGKA